MSSAQSSQPARRMTRDAFFAWAAVREERYEFDGVAPVAMVGGTISHVRIIGNLHFALRSRLRGTSCEMPGPDAGIATIGDAVRYPDAVVTCSKTDGASRLVEAPVVVFEVISPTSGRIDRIEKLREYAGVASLRVYVILEYDSRSLTQHYRERAGQAWTAKALVEDDNLDLPEIGLSIPVAEFYVGIDPPAEPPRSGAAP